MNFISVSQYLNRLQILFFVLLMVPLLVFIALYFFLPDNPVEPRMEYLIIIPFAALVDLFAGMTIFTKKIKSVRTAQGLGAKLDKYFQITIVRYSFLASVGLLLAIGFYLTGNDVFSALYLVALVWSATYWPTGRRVCKELLLKGDEREMVFHKKDRF